MYSVRCNQGEKRPTCITVTRCRTLGFRLLFLKVQGWPSHHPGVYWKCRILSQTHCFRTCSLTRSLSDSNRSLQSTHLPGWELLIKFIARNTDTALKQVILTWSLEEAQNGPLQWPRGWGGGCGREAQEGEGICIYLQLFHTVVQKELRQHCKAIILQLKKHNLSNSLNLVRGSDCLID